MTNRPTHAVFDLDYVKYAAASAAEKRTVVVTHKATGSQMEFNNRTEFWGRGKTLGGWLAEKNAKRTSPFEKEEFDVLDVQTPEPLANALHTAKLMTEGCVAKSGASTVEYHLGEGDGFRVERSTLLRYKDRGHLVKPVLLSEVTEYLVKKYKPAIHTAYECDDAIIVATYKKPNTFVLAADKDAYSQPTRVFNPMKPEQGIINCDCFGELKLDAKGKVRGYGRIHLYYQCLAGDSTDCFKPHCFSDVRWGELSAFKALEFCTSDKEALEVLVNSLKMLYPEPKVVTGWRGDEFEIDWLYVGEEMLAMARMLRFEGDDLKLVDVLNKAGVKYE